MRRKKQIPWRSVLLVLSAAAVGAALGYWGMRWADKLGGGDPLKTAGLLLAGLALAALAYFLQVAVHEGGHMVCGLLTGYRPLSFRIGRVLLVKLDGRWRVRSLHIPGTGGQCLMSPPPQEHPPYRLYHLGGGLANLLLAALALLCLCLWTRLLPLQVFCGMLAVFGLWMAAANLIPMKSGGIGNDGYNAKYLGKDPLAQRCLSAQLWMNASLLEGYSLADMPEEWFTLPKGADLGNPMIAGTAMQAASRLIALGELEEADGAVRALLARDDLLGLYRLELAGEAIYCALVLGRRREAERLYTPEVRRYWKQTLKYYPARVRQAYAWALLAEGDRAEGEKLRRLFEKVAARSPYTGELAGERRLLDRALEAFEREDSGTFSRGKTEKI